MKNKTLLLLTCAFIAIFLLSLPKKINLDEIVDTGSNYLSISINDRIIMLADNQDGVITEEENISRMDWFTLALSYYEVKQYNGKLPKDSSYKVVMNHKDGSVITIFDNEYLSINDTNYKILDKNLIDLEKLNNGIFY